MTYPNLTNPYQKLGQSSLKPKSSSKSSSEGSSSIFNSNVFNPQSSSRFIQPVKKDYLEPEFNLSKETIRQLPRAFLNIIKDIGYKDKPIPAHITEPKQQVLYLATQRTKDSQKLIKEIGRNFIGRAISIPGEIYALASDKFEMPNEIKIPFTKETAPTISGIYRQYEELGKSKLLATLATAGVVAGNVLILFAGASSLKAKTKLPATKQQIKAGERVYSNTTELTYKDLQDITAGRIKTGPKVEAFKEYTGEGVNFTKILLPPISLYCL